MLERTQAVLDRSSKWIVVALSLAVTALVAALDRATGSELSFSIFYLVPVAAVAWVGGPRAGMWMAVVAAAAWLTVDLSAGGSDVPVLVHGWNALVRLGVFMVVAATLGRLREELLRTRRVLAEDWLTGLANGRAFYEALGAEEPAARGALTVGRLDIGDLEYVNERFGRVAGDQLLVAVARTVVEAVPAGALVGRLSGGQFALRLRGSDAAEARTVMEAVQERLRERVTALDRPVTIAIAAAWWRRPPSSSQEVLRHVDRLMTGVRAENRRSALVFDEVALER